MIEARAPSEKFRFLLRHGHDPARVDARVKYSRLRDEELNVSVVSWREQSHEEGEKREEFAVQNGESFRFAQLARSLVK